MSRYGIAEWYGLPFTTLTPGQRRAMACSALDEAPPLQCPFAQKPCHKKGGICAIQPYAEADGRIGEAEGEPVIVCPTRFEQDNVILRWLADIVGFRERHAKVAREVPFMVSTTTEKPAGRIDIVLAEVNDEMKWFGLEVQAVYFSGRKMESDFRALRDSMDAKPPFPGRVRRPDWRSSSAKRLMPQLQVKVPTLRRWFSKIEVAVDRQFFQAMGGPSPNPSHDLNDGDVIWLVPDLSGSRLRRDHWEVLTLEDSAEKLLAARTVNRQDFESALRSKLKPLTKSS